MLAHSEDWAIALERAGAMPRWRSRPDIWAPPMPASVPSARQPLGLAIHAGEQLSLHLDIVVRGASIRALGRQPFHQPAARYSDQFPFHRMQLPQPD